MLELQETTDFEQHATNPDVIHIMLSNGFYFPFIRLC